MIPLADENPTRRVPWATLALIAACVAVYFLVQPIGRATWRDVGFDKLQLEDLEFSLDHAAIPCEVTQGRPLTEREVRDTFFDEGDPTACDPTDRGRAVFPDKQVYLALVYSMFLHGGLDHIGGNLLFLWVFGNNIEDRKGPWKYLLIYLGAGIAAALSHVAIEPDSTVPMVGASGAIAGVMGAYLVWFPRARVKTMIPLGPVVLFRKVSAWLLLAIWFAMQFLLVGADTGIAWAAHVGGFVFGAAAGLVWRGHDRRAAAALPPPVPAA